MKLISTITALSSLIFPAICISCSRPIKNWEIDGTICGECIIFLVPRLAISKRGSIKIFAGSKYSSHMSRIILATKENNQVGARKILVANLTLALRHALPLFAKDVIRKRVILIPIPSRKAANRKRGFSHTQRLVSELQLQNRDCYLEIWDCLNHIRRIQDQSALNIHERELNMGGAFAINKVFYSQIRSAVSSNTAIFLVDDLVTTGATVQAANLALLRLGARVQGVLASCATDGFTH